MNGKTKALATTINTQLKWGFKQKLRLSSDATNSLVDSITPTAKAVSRNKPNSHPVHERPSQMLLGKLSLNW